MLSYDAMQGAREIYKAHVIEFARQHGLIDMSDSDERFDIFYGKRHIIIIETIYMEIGPIIPVAHFIKWANAQKGN